MKTIKTLLFLLTVLGLTACKQVTITTPTNNYVNDAKPDSFALTFTGGIPTDLKIQLNTTDVTSRFTVTDTGATATGDQLADVVYSGRNVFRVTGNNVVKQIVFYYDTTGPEIRILNTDHTNHTVSGYVQDPGGIASVTLDGVSVDLDATNHFNNVAFNDQPTNTFTATDNFGHVSQTQFARNDQEFNGISARLNQNGLNFLTGILTDALQGKDLTNYMTSKPSMTLTNFNLFGICIVCVKMTVKQLIIHDFNTLDLQVQPDKRIDTTLDTSNVHMLLGTTFQFLALVIPVTFESDTDVDLDHLHVTTSLLLSILNSDLTVGTKNTQANVDGVHVTIESIPNILGIGDLINQSISLIANAVVNLMTPMFTQLADNVIVPIASDFIKDIPINLQLVTLGDGEKLDIKATPSFLDTPDQGITVDLATHIWAPEPLAGIPGALGSRYHDGATPTLGTTDPDGNPFDFGASISANVVNQAFLAAYEAGVTTMTITPDAYPNATQDGIQVYAQGTDFGAGAIIQMRIEPSSPPYVDFMPSADGAPGEFDWHDVHLAFDLYKPEWGEYRTLFGVTFDVKVPFDVNSTDDGYLSIGIEQLPTIHISSTDSSGMILIPPAFINGTLDYFMPMVMPRLATALKVVPLPRIYNHTLHMNKFWVEGAGHSLALTGNLVPVATTDAAPAPTTQVDYQTQNVTVNQETVSSTGVVTSNAVTIDNGAVTIDVNGINPNPTLGVLETRYQVDGGGWSIWKHRDTIHLTRLLAGPHTVTVCSRTVLLKREQNCPVVTFDTSVAPSS